MGRAWVFGDDLDTDQIVPGRYAPFMVGQDKFHAYAFCDARPEFAKAVRPGDVLVGGENFGCGSSREYAVAALAKHGIGGIVAKSFPKLRGAIRAQGATPAGPRFARYYNGDPAAFDTEAGIPFTGSFMLTGDEIRVTKLPAGRAAKTLHIGPYHTLSEEYRRLEKWLTEEGHRPAEGRWEAYLDDETKTPEKHLRTEVYWPLAR